jgi:hypothetical protein
MQNFSDKKFLTEELQFQIKIIVNGVYLHVIQSYIMIS